MRASSLIFGLLAAVLVVTVFGTFLTDIGVESTLETTEYNSTALKGFDKMRELSSMSENMTGRLFNEEPRGLLDLIGSFIATAYDGLKVTQQAFEVAGTMLFSAVGITSIPEVFAQILGLMLVFGLIFLIVSALLKYRT